MADARRSECLMMCVVMNNRVMFMSEKFSSDGRSDVLNVCLVI